MSVRAKGSGKRLKSSKEKGMSRNNRKCGHCQKPGHIVKKCPQLQSRLVDEDYRPDMSQITRGDGYVPVDDAFVGLAADNYVTHLPTTIPEDDFLQ